MHRYRIVARAIAVLSVISMLVSLVPPIAPAITPVEEAHAATRLGLHVTQEELNIWRQRMTDNVNGSNGQTYQAMYQNRILAGANAFKSQSHPDGDGFWAGNTSSTCVTNSGPVPSRTNGQNLLKSAYVFLLTGDRSYADPVKTELLNQIVQPGTRFGDRTKWCIYNFDGAFDPINWALRLTYAYDYLIAGGYTGFTAQNKTDIVNWIRDAGVYYEAKTSLQITQNVMSGAQNNPPNYTCNQWACPGSAIGTTHWQGFTVNNFHGTFSNRTGIGLGLATAAAILANDSTLLQKAKWWFQEQIQFGTFPDGTPFEQFRWSDNTANPDVGSGSSWTHDAWNWGVLISIADMIARTGDTSLYTYSTSNGQFGTAGGPKSLDKIMLKKARMANGTIQQYGTTNGTLNSSTLLNQNHEGGHSEDWASMQANIFYKNGEIHTAMARVQTPNSGCGGAGCFSNPAGTMVDNPFMFSNLDSGQINPYSLTASSPTPTPTPTPCTPAPILAPPPLSPPPLRPKTTTNAQMAKTAKPPPTTTLVPKTKEMPTAPPKAWTWVPQPTPPEDMKLAGPKQGSGPPTP
jgi:hypothetical protein